MLVFEDLHWIDDETQAFLSLLADSIGTARILLHPGTSGPSWQTSADQMLTTLLGSDEGVIPLKHLIAEKTEGNPFFIEEIYQALIEEGVLVRHGAVKLTRPLNALKIPGKVQAILAARMTACQSPRSS